MSKPNAHLDCDICGTTNDVSYYDEWTCTKCGQEYMYDEASQIVLTEHQFNLLRIDAGYEPLPETTEPGGLSPDVPFEA